MRRELHTPLIIWVCAAVCVHLMMGEGGEKVAALHEDRSAILEMANNIRNRVRMSEQTFEVSDLAAIQKVEPKEDEPVPPKPPEAKKEPPKPEPKKEAEKPKPPPPPPEKKVVVVPEPAKPPPPPPPPPQADKRVAVKQHVKPNQEDNPNAKFVGDEANKVEEETVARQTTTDQDDPNPTPGANHAGADPTPGDSDRTKIANAEKRAGEKDKAPGEKGTQFDVEPPPAAAARAAAGPTVPTRGDGREAAPPGATPMPPEAGGPAGPSAPEVWTSEGGTWAFNPIRPGGAASSARGAGKDSSARNGQGAGATKWLGLGGTPGPGQINLNLTHEAVVASVGVDQLRKERQADGERRLSEHRGSWKASSFERVRSAIENYVGSVKPGNQTALNTAAVPFAGYLVAIHNRIHPLFADSFLGSLEGMPANHPLNDLKLVTRVEIVLSRDGRMIRRGVVRTSGVTAFDVAAIDTIDRAAPFGPAPSAILSPDGNVYLHWEFHRDAEQCGTANARPFILNTPPPAPPVDPNPPPPAPRPSTPREGFPENTPETRHG